ncbi:MAG: hypothetical protein ACI8UR_002121 [Natronomonas sp.]|jgi:hypothetical protein|uniref:DUF7266 family protein n=1 Tax=Natronomonas sp. TaxID=2184060 RepID=UPI00398A0040
MTFGDDRAVSPVFGYALTLSISTILVGGLLITAGGYVDSQRSTTAESELRVLGQQVSADISSADRLVRTDDVGTVSVGRSLPSQVVGSTYQIHVRDSGGPTSPYLELTAQNPDVSVVVGITSKTSVAITSAAGGDIEVVYDAAANEVVLQND